MATGTDVEIYRPVGADDNLSGMDSRLLEIVAQHPNITPEELALELNIPSMSPARCAQRVKEILKSQDWLSLNEKKALLLRDLIDLRERMYRILDDGTVKVTKNGEVVNVDADSTVFNSMIRLFKEWRSLLESMQTDIDGSTVTLRKGHAEILSMALEVMFRRFMERVVDAAQAQKPITMTLAREIMEEVMPMGFAYLETRTAA